MDLKCRLCLEILQGIAFLILFRFGKQGLHRYPDLPSGCGKQKIQSLYKQRILMGESSTLCDNKFE